VHTVRDEWGNLRRLGYDLTGRMVKTEAWNGEAWEVEGSVEEDVVNRLVSAANGLGHKNSREYNGWGQVAEIADREAAAADRMSAVYSYDAVGRVESVTDAFGVSELYEYDAIGRVRAVRSEDEAGSVLVERSAEYSYGEDGS